MLAVSPLRNSSSTHQDGREGEILGSFSIGDDHEFPDFSGGGSLLDSIDFDDLFVGMDDGDVLPDLEMDPEILAEFSVEDSPSEMNTSMSMSMSMENFHDEDGSMRKLLDAEEDKVSAGSGTGNSGVSSGDEIASERSPSVDQSVGENPSAKQSDRGRKSSAQSKNSQGKRKVKVDWTPELHRRFVQAVEQLGVDKAVPSRILELMGIDSLTRHNIASHLQKYRSHRKHLLAREAEAASWSQRRQMYGGAATTATTTTGAGSKREMMSPWPAPTMGFPPHPPMAPLMHHHQHQLQFRPLHVWGHPSMDPSFIHMWPKHLVVPSSHSPPLPPLLQQPPPAAAWAPPPPPPPADPSFWPPHPQRVPNSLAPRFPPPLPSLATPTTRYASSSSSPLVPGIPAPPAPPPTSPHAMYKVDPNIGHTTSPHPPLDLHPSKESIDAALGDVLSKPWQPLPLGLKPPSVDSVLVELQRQGIPKIPPTSCA